jgi:hypothetical protein
MRAPWKATLAMTALLLAASACAQPARGAQPSASLPSFSPSPSPSATPDQSVVPDIRHISLSLAKIQIQSAGLKLKVTDKTTTMSFIPNTVLTQNPKPNREVDPRTVVKVTVSTPPQCDPSYPTVCVTPFSSDVTCQSIGVRNLEVKPPDPYHLDPNRDGVGCESRRGGG